MTIDIQDNNTILDNTSASGLTEFIGHVVSTVVVGVLIAGLHGFMENFPYDNNN